MSNLFRILVVCTGNICRSAQAEQLIRARVAEHFPALELVITVESAGTGALVGSGMPAQAADLSAQHGGVPVGHFARQLTTEHVRGADLVLAMTENHRSAIVRLLPRASRNTFTLTEFAMLLESAEQTRPTVVTDFSALDVTDKLRNAVKWAAARRGYLAATNEHPADVVDPYRRSDEVYAESIRQIVDALDRTQRAAVKLRRGVGA